MLPPRQDICHGYVDLFPVAIHLSHGFGVWLWVFTLPMNFLLYLGCSSFCSPFAHCSLFCLCKTFFCHSVYFSFSNVRFESKKVSSLEFRWLTYHGLVHASWLCINNSPPAYTILYYTIQLSLHFVDLFE